MPLPHRLTLWLCLAWPISAHAHMQGTPEVVAILMAALLFPVVLVCVVAAATPSRAKWFWGGVCLTLYPLQVFLAAIVGGVLTFGALEHTGKVFVGAFLLVGMWTAVVRHLRRQRLSVSAGQSADRVGQSTDRAGTVAIAFACAWSGGLAGALALLRGPAPGLRVLLGIALVASGAVAWAVWRRLRAPSRP